MVHFDFLTNGIWHDPALNMFGASSELASVMEFGFNRTVLYKSQRCMYLFL